jgi:Tfp pilus assembly PilM family ATPase
MPHILVLDWDQHEIRLVLGQTIGRKTQVLALNSLPLPALGEDPEGGDQALGTQIKEWLAPWRADRPRVLVALPRSAVELLYLTLPPATDEELPELVTNLAVQESPTISEQTLLDFLPSAGTPEAPRLVLAAALADEEQRRIRARLAAAGLTPQRIVLRPLGGASLFRQLIASSDRTCLVINRIGQDVELNLVAPGRIVFSRTVRLPEQASEEDVADRLVAEAKRTVLAAPREHVGDEGIRNVYVFGRPAEYESLAADLGRALSLPVEVLDPLDAVEAPEVAVPPQPERFAPLLGVLLDEAADSHAIDLLHPRRPPHPWKRWRIPALAASGLALVALALGFYVWGNLAEVNADNERLAARLRDLNETARKAVKQKQRIEAIAAWKGRDVNWLEELRDLSLRFPGPRDAVVMRMSMRPSQGAGGLIDLQGLVRDPTVVVNLESQVRDEFRTVRSRRVQQRTQENDYTWLYETSVSVAPRRPDQYGIPPADAAPDSTEAVPKPAPPAVPRKGAKP